MGFRVQGFQGLEAFRVAGNTYWDTWAEKSSRPLQKGRLHGVAWLWGFGFGLGFRV